MPALSSVAFVRVPGNPVWNFDVVELGAAADMVRLQFQVIDADTGPQLQTGNASARQNGAGAARAAR